MSVTRIFVCYATSGDERGAAVAQQLIDDLQANGANVVTGNEHIVEENFVEYLNQELPRCQYVILVQTPQALKSLRVQTTISMALNLVTQQRMKGVLRLLAAPLDNEDEQPLWVTPRTFDASQDYPRARDKVLLELGLLSIDDEIPELEDQLTSLSIASSTITLPTDESPSALSPDKQPTTPNRRVSALLDRPAPISPWRRSPRLWISIVSATLILAIVLTIGVAATQAKKGSPNIPNHTAPSVNTSKILTRVPTATPTTAIRTATPTTSAGTPTPTLTVTTTDQATPTPIPAPIHQTIIDDLNNWSKTYSHTTNLDFDTNNSQWMDGDTSLLYRPANTPEEVVWKLSGMTSFQAITYFWPPQSGSPLNDLSVYTSADDVHWTTATPTLSGGTGNWIEYTYTLSNLSNVNFVQMRWSVTSNNNWSQQIGQVTLKS
jgi:TIR domain